MTQKHESAWEIPPHGGVVSRTSVSLDAADVAVLADVIRGLSAIRPGRITGTDVVRLALQRLWQAMYSEGRDAVFASMASNPSHWGQCPACGEQPALRGRNCPACGMAVPLANAEVAFVKDSEED